MTEQEQAGIGALNSEPKGSGEDQDKLADGEEKSEPEAPPKHVIRILGSYSLLTFFTLEVQEKFFGITSCPGFEKFFSFDCKEYVEETDSFQWDDMERDFELGMTNKGFVREVFWKDSFPPIFKFKKENQGIRVDWNQFLPEATKQSLVKYLGDPNNEQFYETFLYGYSLFKLEEELKQIINEEVELKIHIGLNQFAIVNVGITIKFNRKENDSFNDLCKRAYKMVSHLKEDPLKNLEFDFKQKPAIVDNFLSSIFGKDPIKDAIKQKIKSNLIPQSRNHQLTPWESIMHVPRLAVSYFQVLAITMIHLFLYEKAIKFSQQNECYGIASDIVPFGVRWKIFSLLGGFCCDTWPSTFSRFLAKPWSLSNQIKIYSRERLPPLRHVVFMYQFVHTFTLKSVFLRNNTSAILTLGNNVGWKPSEDPPFPPFENYPLGKYRFNDSSLLENSCCLIFPQGLIVVTPVVEAHLYLGGAPSFDETQETSCYSPSLISYEKYWKLIFKLFIRVVETRILLGMINRYLSDCHIDFIVRSRKNSP